MKAVETNEQELMTVVDQVGEMTIDEELQTLLFFKTCSVEREMDILKIKLSRSGSLRDKVIRRRETKFSESFPFYFVAPELVSQIGISIKDNNSFDSLIFQILFDYNIRFPGDDSLINKWPKLMIRIFSLLNKPDAEYCARLGFDEISTSFIMLLRQFSMKKTFALNIEKFIVYSNVIIFKPLIFIN